MIRNRSARLPFTERDIVSDPKSFFVLKRFHHNAAFVFFEISKISLCWFLLHSEGKENSINFANS
jgi:hypothetical protein